MAKDRYVYSDAEQDMFGKRIAAGDIVSYPSVSGRASAQTNIALIDSIMTTKADGSPLVNKYTFHLHENTRDDERPNPDHVVSFRESGYGSTILYVEEPTFSLRVRRVTIFGKTATVNDQTTVIHRTHDLIKIDLPEDFTLLP